MMQRENDAVRTLFILNDAPYGSERSYNGLRLAGSLSKAEGEEVKLFLLGDAASCARRGQKVAEGVYNIQIMLGRVARNKAEVGVCGTCMDARDCGFGTDGRYPQTHSRRTDVVDAVGGQSDRILRR